MDTIVSKYKLYKLNWIFIFALFVFGLPLKKKIHLN